MSVKTINRIIAIIIILSNIYWIPISYEIIKTSGGAMGFGFMFLPFLLFLNILFIPSILIFFNKYKDNTFILSINILGLALIIFISWLAFFK